MDDRTIIEESKSAYGRHVVKPRKRTATVWLEMYEDQSGEHVFYCNDCRTPIMQYSGDVYKVLPGSVPMDIGDTPFTIQCKNDNCRKKYKFVPGVQLLK